MKINVLIYLLIYLLVISYHIVYHTNYYKKINQLSDNFYNQQRYKDLDMEYNKYPLYNNWEKVFDKDINFHPLWFEQYFKIS